jgi:hypothetical protein
VNRDWDETGRIPWSPDKDWESLPVNGVLVEWEAGRADHGVLRTCRGQLHVNMEMGIVVVHPGQPEEGPGEVTQ